MGDTYNIGGQVGAVGPGAKAEGNTFQQVQVAASDFDPEMLARDLSTLKAALQEQASEHEHYLALAAVSSAEEAAKQEDAPGALEKLREVGKWALDVGTKIGVPVAVKAIQSAIGQ